MGFDLLSVLCTFENSTKCDEISFNPHSFNFSIHFTKNSKFYKKGTMTVISVSQYCWTRTAEHFLDWGG